MAMYPNQVKQFKTHVNQIEDVDANDINAIQDEVTQIQKVLGLLPTRYVERLGDTTNFSSSFTGAAATGGLEADIVGPVAGYTQLDRNVKAGTTDYASVAERLDAIQRGHHAHVFKLRGSNITVVPSAAQIDQQPRGVYLPAGNAITDPFGLYNGVGVTLKKSGFYSFDAHATWNLQGATAAVNNGIYNLAIDVDNDWLDGTDRDEHTANNWMVIQSVTRTGFFHAGSRVTVRVSHNATSTQKLRLISLGGYMVSESDWQPGV
jgi:hypothetical protein